MPAWGEEIDAADLEGIDIMTLVAPQEILRDAVGNVTGVLCKEMALGDYDKSGRRRPVAGHNPDFVVEADTVIPSLARSSTRRPSWTAPPSTSTGGTTSRRTRTAVRVDRLGVRGRRRGHGAVVGGRSHRRR